MEKLLFPSGFLNFLFFLQSSEISPTGYDCHGWEIGVVIAFPTCFFFMNLISPMHLFIFISDLTVQILHKWEHLDSGEPEWHLRLDLK